MALEKGIIKAKVAEQTTFDYKAREINPEVSAAAKSFVVGDAFKSSDFKISDLVAQQARISQLESDAHQDQINAQVMERLKEVEERAYKEGFDLGLIEGAEKAFQESRVDLTEKVRVFESLLKDIEQQKGSMMVQNEAELVRLVYLIAKKIALRDLEENHEVVLNILKSLVSEIQADEQVTVRLSSEDMYFLETLQDKNNQGLDLLKRVKLVASDDVKPGGCMIETEYGSVDASIEERLERTWQTLEARIPRRQK